MKDKHALQGKSPQELRAFIELLEEKHHAELLKQSSEAQKWQNKYNLLLEQFKLAQQKRFSHSSEKCPMQEELFNEAESAVAADESTQTKKVAIAAHEREQRATPKRMTIPEHIERERIDVDVTDEEKICQCGCEKHRIGETVSEQLEVIPPTFKVSQYVRPKYACKACEEGVTIAPMPALFLPKCMAGPSLVAYTIINKYLDHLPLYRQETIWNRHGFKLPRNTLCGWVIAAFERVNPLLALLKEDIVNAGYVQADETTVQVMKEPGRKNQRRSYMWCYRGHTSRYVALLYEYQETREAKHPRAFLRNFKGYLQTDGYKGYDWVNQTPDIIHLGCMSHARRPFAKLIKLANTTGQSDIAIKLIGELYQIERKAKEQGLNHQQRYELRLLESKPVLDALKSWVDKMACTTSSKGTFGKGIAYIQDRWHELTNFLKDGRLEIDNNNVENNIRPFALGRKNWIFKGSPRGASAGACFYSLIETCKANNIEPFKYLHYLFQRIPLCQNTEDYKQLLPYNIDPEVLA